jgi:hypothetical protein
VLFIASELSFWLNGKKKKKKKKKTTTIVDGNLLRRNLLQRALLGPSPTPLSYSQTSRKLFSLSRALAPKHSSPAYSSEAKIIFPIRSSRSQTRVPTPILLRGENYFPTPELSLPNTGTHSHTPPRRKLFSQSGALALPNTGVPTPHHSPHKRLTVFSQEYHGTLTALHIQPPKAI